MAWTTGDYETATLLAVGGLKDFWSGTYPPMVGYNLIAVLDSVAQDSEQWFAQVSTGREALQLLSSCPDHYLSAIMHQTLANAALSSGELDVAQENFRLANEQLALETGTEWDRTAQAITETGEARMDFINGNLGSAANRINRIEPALVHTTNRFVLSDYYLTRGDIFSASHQPKEAEAAFDRAITVSEAGLEEISTERERLVWTRLYEHSYKAMVNLVQTENPSRALSVWERYRSAPLLQTEKSSRDQSKRSRYIAAEAEQRFQSIPILADRDTILISFIMFRQEVGGWIYDSRNTLYRKLPLSAIEIQELAQRFAQDCATPYSSVSRLQYEARQLYQVLIRPFLDVIGQHHKLLIEADGILDSIAFEALIDNQGRYLGDDYLISMSPGLFYLAEARPPIRSVKHTVALVVSNPYASLSVHGTLSPLPRADEEARNISMLLPHSRLLIGGHASKSEILASLQSSDIFHFAGHAIANKSGSGLVISSADAANTSELLDAIHFERTPLKHTRLVVLSACSSAGNASQTLGGIESLARIFIVSGVPQVVASRWPVDSDATTELMEAFYTRLVAGASISVAFQQARQQIRTSQAFSHPYYWAGFSVFGTT
jgi:CHAT domain-containing protein